MGALTFTTAEVQDLLDEVPGKQNAVCVDSITTTTTWSGADPFTQSVTLGSYTATASTQVDIQPDAATIAQLMADGVKAIYIANSAGELTLTVIGAAPSVALTLQVTCMEVVQS